MPNNSVNSDRITLRFDPGNPAGYAYRLGLVVMPSNGENVNGFVVESVYESVFL